MAEAAGWQSLIVSGDRDALQLVTDSTHLDYPTTGLSKTLRLDPEGWRPSTSSAPDSTPTSRHWWESRPTTFPACPKWAPRPPRSGSASTAPPEASSTTPTRSRAKRENLRAALADVERNLELNLLVRDLDVPVTLEDSVLTPPDREAVEPLFDALEFNQIRERLFETFSARFPDANLDAEPTHALPEVKVVSDAEGLRSFLHAHEGPLGLAVIIDTSYESLSTKAKRDDAARSAEAIAVALVAASSSPERPAAGAAISLTDADQALESELAAWLADPASPNSSMTSRTPQTPRMAGPSAQGAVEDTLLSGYLIQPDRRSFSFSDLVAQHLNGSVEPKDYIGGEEFKNQKEATSQQSLFDDEPLAGVSEADLARAAVHGMLLHLCPGLCTLSSLTAGQRGCSTSWSFPG